MQVVDVPSEDDSGAESESTSSEDSDNGENDAELSPYDRAKRRIQVRLLTKLVICHCVHIFESP